jgi:PAS domain S-box-containing protein
MPFLSFYGSSSRIFEANSAAQRLTGRTCEELVSLNIDDVLKAERGDLQSDASFQAADGFLLHDCESDTWAPVQVSVANFGSGEPFHRVLTVRDLREQRQVERRLEQTESELKRVLASVSDCIWSAEVSGGKWRLRYCSPPIEAITGRPPSAFVGRDVEYFYAIVHPADRSRVRDNDRRVADLMEPSAIEYRVMLPDGGFRWVRESLHPRRDTAGRLNVDAVMSDITAQKAAELALMESRQQFEAFMNAIPLVGFFKNNAGQYVYANQHFARKFDRPVSSIVGKHGSDMWPAAIAARLRVIDMEVMAGTHPVESRESVPTPDGVLREWWVVKFPIPDGHGGVLLGGIALDLTDRRHLEESLQRTDQRYRLLWQRNLAGVFRATSDGRILDCNDRFARIYGFSSGAAMLNRSTTDLYFDLEVRKEFLTRLRAAGYLLNYELPMRRADGAPIWILENVTLLVEDGREVLEGTIIDISDRKRVDEALRTSEANYRTLIDHLDQAIFLKDRNLRYVMVNPLFCKGINRREEELIGKTISDLYPDEHTEKSRAIERRVLAEGRSIETEDVLKIEGQARQVRVRRTPVKDDAGAVVGVLGICWDVTDQRALEAQLRHVDKMDAVGQLAGGIAHDFNNLLTVMLGNVSYALSEANDLQATRTLVRNAEKAGLRAAELTKTLLGFSRQSTVATVPLDLGQAIAEVVEMTRPSIPANVRLDVQTIPDLWPVQFDPVMMNQVLTNLTLNARDAMPAGGVITFSTSHFEPDADHLAAHVESRPGEYVRLVVKDTGTGIAPELRQRIFEPFFTTKPKAKGTGLGLAIVFSIVKQHNGWIECDSEPGRGTCFTLYLPRCSAAVTPPAPTVSVPAANGAATILFVDDEPLICQLSQSILSRVGFKVLLAENGERAVDLYRDHRAEIVLVILDAVMPRLSGRQTLAELNRLNPRVPVLFSSGFASEVVDLNEMPQVRGFLPKPYRAEQLVNQVNEILGQIKSERALASES